MKNNLYSILFTPLAAEDLDEIYTYIETTLAAPIAAENLLTEMEKRIGQLREFPHIGSEPADRYLADKGYRKLVVGNYLVLYLTDEQAKEAVIMRIVYGSREYRNLL